MQIVSGKADEVDSVMINVVMQHLVGGVYQGRYALFPPYVVILPPAFKYIFSMSTFPFLSFLFYCLFEGISAMLLFFFLAVTIDANEWSYTDPNDWGGTCSTGKEQSPINIDTGIPICHVSFEEVLLYFSHYRTHYPSPARVQRLQRSRLNFRFE